MSRWIDVEFDGARQLLLNQLDKITSDFVDFSIAGQRNR